jgi:hypothetical protein
MLSQIGSVTIPPEVTLKMRLGHALSSNEKEILVRIPAIGSSLLANIPRLEEVARIILYQNKLFDGGGFPEDDVSGVAIPLGARMLKVLCDLAQIEARGTSRALAVQELRGRAGYYDPRVLSAVAALVPSAAPSADTDTKMLLAVKFSHLRIGHILQSDVETKSGILLVPTGSRITPMLIHWLRNFSTLYGIKEPILVLNPTGSSSKESFDTKWIARDATDATRAMFQNTP